MDPQRASQTAIIICFQRAFHTANARPPIFLDEFAERLLTQDEVDRATGQALRLAASQPGIEGQPSVQDWYFRTTPAHPHVISRARYNEEQLDKALAEGVDQYVILGAGLDTFAWRRPDLTDRLCVFEVDYPTSQASKRERLVGAELQVPSNLSFLPVDFENETVGDVLRRSDFDSSRMAFVSWLGVSMYLSRSAIDATMRSLHEVAAPGSTLVFDYWEAEAFRRRGESPLLASIFEAVTAQGEPFLSGFEPQEIPLYLSNLGYELVEDLSRDEQHERFFGHRTDGLKPGLLGRYLTARLV
jgi:methyltransferase (TIGR00027 family)